MGFCIVLTTIVNSFTNVSLSYYSKKADVKFNLLRVLGQNEMQPDIRVTGHFTVEEALYGCSKTVEYARQVISVNPMITVVGVDGRVWWGHQQCELAVCPVCNGAKHVFKRKVKHYSSSDKAQDVITRSATYPCYHCHQTGSVLVNKHGNNDHTHNSCSNCDLIRSEEHRIDVTIPPRSKPGEFITIPEMGNQVIINNQVVTGSLVLSIDKVATGDFQMYTDHFELTLKLTPLEALNGFLYNKTLDIDGITGSQHVIVDRRNKTTLLSQTVRVKGMKVCDVHIDIPSEQRAGNQPAQSETNEAIMDATVVPANEKMCSSFTESELLIKFALLSEQETDELSEISVDVDENGNMMFTGQDDIDAFVKKYELKRESQRARGLLKLLEKLKK
jgi:DnaJ-class molecular chaperone